MSRLIRRGLAELSGEPEPADEQPSEGGRRRLPMGPLQQVAKVGQTANAARQKLQSPAQAVLKDLLANPSLLSAFAVAVGSTAVGLGVVATNTANDAKEQAASVGSLPPEVQAQLDALTSSTVDNRTPSEVGFSTTTTVGATTTQGSTASGTTSTLPAAIVQLPGRVDSVNDDLNGIRAELASLGTSQEGLSGSQQKLADLASRTASAAADLADITDDLNSQLAATDGRAGDALVAAQRADVKAQAGVDAAAAAQASADEALAPDVHSTGEVLTDQVWVDGKPIYRRSFTLSAAGQGVTVVDSGLTMGQVDSVIRLDAVGVFDFSGRFVSTPFYDSTTKMFVTRLGADGVSVFVNGFTVSNITVVAEYTKP